MSLSIFLLDCLEGDNKENRERFKQLLRHELFTPLFSLTLAQQRQLALERLQMVCRSKLISVLDFERNPLNIFAMHEIAGMADGSMATKMTVQFNLFGGTLLKLGTAQHRKYLPGIDSLRIIGCFALTELGYGNNAVEMETTAAYDAAAKEFVIATPSTLSQKYWITNSAVHANFAIVFAQLQLAANQQSQGIHAFLVPIRNAKGAVCKGVGIEDMQMKMDCNGVDNGRLAFCNVRVPLEGLLNRHSTIDPVSGAFSSAIAGKRERFLRVADQLLSGRLCIASMSIGATKMVLAIAEAYFSSRLAAGPHGKSDMPIGNFQLTQNAVIPLLCRTIVLGFGLVYVKQAWCRLESASKAEADEVVRLCCVIKPLITWNFVEAASVCRERCGGQGYLSCNLLASSVGFAHAGVTAEGDNAVLMQKVAKELLAAFEGGNFQVESESKEALFVLLASRLQALLSRLSACMKQASKEASVFAAWMLQQSDLIQAVARAYGEYECAKAFLQTVQLQSTPASIKKGLLSVFAVYATASIKADCNSFVTLGLLDAAALQKINQQAAAAISEVHALRKELIAGFGIHDFMIKAPIGKDWQSPNDLAKLKAAL